MRLIIPMAIFTILSSAPVQAQAWEEHAYPDAGFAVQFPVEPRVEAGSYETADGTSVPATVYSASEGSGVYTVIVAELANTPADQRNAIDDAVSQLRKTGQIELDVNARINREFGRELSVAENDGSRSTMGIFFFNHRLYELRARVLPPDPKAGSADALRFQQSLRFTGGNDGRGAGRGGQGPGRFGRRRFAPGDPPPVNPSAPADLAPSREI
jgi:hypothetical protein